MSDAPREPGHDPAARRLGFVVEGEARRLLREDQLAADPERLAQGWERRFVADGVRAGEMIRLYEELGFEVAADPIRPDTLPDACTDCRLVAALAFQMIYTRRREGA